MLKDAMALSKVEQQNLNKLKEKYVVFLNCKDLQAVKYAGAYIVEGVSHPIDSQVSRNRNGQIRVRSRSLVINRSGQGKEGGGVGNLPWTSDQPDDPDNQHQDVSQFEAEDLDEGVVNESKVKNTMSNFLVLERKGKINLSDMHQPSSMIKPLGSSSVVNIVHDPINNQFQQLTTHSMIPQLRSQPTFGTMPAENREKQSQQLFQFAQEK